MADPIAGTLAATYIDIAKEDVLDRYDKQFESNAQLLAWLSGNKVTKEFDGVENVVTPSAERAHGKWVTIDVHKSGNPTSGASADGYKLPARGNQGSDQQRLYMKRNSIGFQIEEWALQAAKKNKGSVAEPLAIETKGAHRDMMKDINRQLASDGSGILCLNGVASDTTTNIVDCYHWDFPLKYFKGHDNRIFQFVHLSDMTTMTPLQSTFAGCVFAESSAVFTVGSEAIAWDAGTPDTLADGDPIGNFYGLQDGATQFEMMGLRGIFDEGNLTADAYYNKGTDLYYNVGGARPGDGTQHNLSVALTVELQNVDAEAETYWRGKVFGATDPPTRADRRDVTYEMLMEAHDYVGEMGGMVEAIYTTPGLRRKLGRLVQQAEGQYWTNTITIPGGIKVPSWNGTPILVDTDCTNTDIYFIPKGALKLYQLEKPHYLTRGGGQILTRIADYAAYSARLIWHANLACHRRNTCVRLTDLIENAQV